MNSVLHNKTRISLLSSVFHSLWLQVYSWHLWIARTCWLSFSSTYSFIPAASLHTSCCRSAEPLGRASVTAHAHPVENGDCSTPQIWKRLFISYSIFQKLASINFGVSKKPPKCSFWFNIACIIQILIYCKKLCVVCGCYSIYISWVTCMCQVWC